MVFWAHPSPRPKRHLDRFTVTDRPSVTIGRIYVRNTAVRPNTGCLQLLEILETSWNLIDPPGNF